MTIKLTEKQYYELEDILKAPDKERFVKTHMQGWDIRVSLNDLSLDDFIKCLYMEDYVVEPEFKIFEVGDYVFSKTWGKAGKVVTTNDTVITTVSFKDHVRNMRHATKSEIRQEKERRFWARHGRDVWELKKGDVLYDKSEGYCGIVREAAFEFSNTIVVFQDGCWDSLDNVEESYKIVSFVEQRLDVSHDDE